MEFLLKIVCISLVLLGFIYLAGYLWTKAVNNARYDFLVDKMTEDCEEEFNEENNNTGKEK